MISNVFWVRDGGKLGWKWVGNGWANWGGSEDFPEAVVQLQELVERSEALPQEPVERREVKSYAPRAAFPYKACCFSFVEGSGYQKKKYIKNIQEYC